MNLYINRIVGLSGKSAGESGIANAARRVQKTAESIVANIHFDSVSSFLSIVVFMACLNAPTVNGRDKIGDVRKNSIGMELTFIPSGKDFSIGSPVGEKLRDKDEGPLKKVTIGKDFWMGKYEVTQAEYEKVMGTKPSGFRDCPRCPVETVSWEDAKGFIQKLNEKNDGFVYRLPSEAEWEYAARAGTKTAFSFGNSLSPSQANFDSRYPYGGAAKGQFIVKTEPVGSYKPNAWGLHDMHGNVWEWVEDIYVKAGYQGLATDGSANVATGDQYKRVRRGGGWDSWGKALRSANRGWKNPRDRNKNGGFRVAASSR
jgi:formylglycine-generating enzyme required for sulfatase activity